jgi:hypothetical protein
VRDHPDEFGPLLGIETGELERPILQRFVPGRHQGLSNTTQEPAPEIVTERAQVCRCT